MSQDITNKPDRYKRRQSVAAEKFNPEEAEEIQKVVHPKTDEQRARLQKAVTNILLFRDLDDEQLQDVIDAMKEKDVKAGEKIIEQGQDGDFFYVIEKGDYEVYVSHDEVEKKVNTYKDQGSFGELALMYNQPRAATVISITDGKLWSLDRQTFRALVLTAAYKKRKNYESLLSSVPMLSQLSEFEKMNLADALVARSFNDGDSVVKQGDLGNTMYFVESGECRIVMEQGGQKKEISRLGKGGYFGELALLTRNARAASVYAVGKSKCAELDVEAFERILGPCKEIMSRNADQYQTQLKEIFGENFNSSDLR
ncbi:hypothetical protein SNEBB_004434 [Seison nebaliae]|nr:hypothetical protein SNEBB_004434 [Seison nebaliae]